MVKSHHGSAKNSSTSPPLRRRHSPLEDGYGRLEITRMIPWCVCTGSVNKQTRRFITVLCGVGRNRHALMIFLFLVYMYVIQSLKRVQTPDVL